MLAKFSCFGAWFWGYSFFIWEWMPWTIEGCPSFSSENHPTKIWIHRWILGKFPRKCGFEGEIESGEDIGYRFVWKCGMIYRSYPQIFMATYFEARENDDPRISVVSHFQMIPAPCRCSNPQWSHLVAIAPALTWISWCWRIFNEFVWKWTGIPWTWDCCALLILFMDTSSQLQGSQVFQTNPGCTSPSDIC